MHLDTPRGRQHIAEVVAHGQMTTPTMVQKVIEAAKELPDEDYHTSALEKMINALDVIQQWVVESRSNLDRLTPPEYRYKDRAGQEQQRTEVAIYERALDRLSRHLSSMSKVSMQDKVVSLGKAQVDMMIRMVMGVVAELRLNNEQADRARMLLLDKLEREANLQPRVEDNARKQLVPTVINGVG